jgi:hypothetical protein
VPGDNALEPPLTVAKSGANIALTWSAGCLATDSDSEIYEGTVGNFTSHVPIARTTAGATTATFAPGTGSRYYLVVPTNDAGEGSYGLGVGGAQRPVSATACHM